MVPGAGGLVVFAAAYEYGVHTAGVKALRERGLPSTDTTAHDPRTSSGEPVDGGIGSKHGPPGTTPRVVIESGFGQLQDSTERPPRKVEVKPRYD